jgi:Ricin-type beta-trefoil lectin domain-like
MLKIQVRGHLHKKSIASASSIFMGSMLSLFLVGQASAGEYVNTIRLLNKNTLLQRPHGDGRDKCLGIADRSTVFFAVANQWSCANYNDDPIGARSQAWEVEYVKRYDGVYYSLRNVHSRQCLTLDWRGGAVGRGGHFVQYPCFDHPYQLFKREIKDGWPSFPTAKLTLFYSGLCLGIDDRRTDNFNGGINQWNCVPDGNNPDGSNDIVGRNSQRWGFN